MAYPGPTLRFHAGLEAAEDLILDFEAGFQQMRAAAGLTMMTTLQPSEAAISATLAAIRFDAAGLVPAIAQAEDTGEVLMMAWMNATRSRKPCAPAGPATGRVRAARSGARGRVPGRASMSSTSGSTATATPCC